MVSKGLIAAGALAVCGTALAQTAAPPKATPKYESALADYQPYRDEKPANWRDVNDTMGALGGHNAHLREVAKNVTAAGTVLEIDRAANRVRIESDGVKALGWPAGVSYWLLKSPPLADQIKPGERVAFTLEQEGDAYRITGFGSNAPQAAQPAAPKAPHDMKNMGGMK